VVIEEESLTIGLVLGLFGKFGQEWIGLWSFGRILKERCLCFEVGGFL
jgi:hypothetical protein